MSANPSTGCRSVVCFGHCVSSHVHHGLCDWHWAGEDLEPGAASSGGRLGFSLILFCCSTNKTKILFLWGWHRYNGRFWTPNLGSTSFCLTLSPGHCHCPRAHSCLRSAMLHLSPISLSSTSFVTASGCWCAPWNQAPSLLCTPVSWST